MRGRRDLGDADRCCKPVHRQRGGLADALLLLREGASLEGGYPSLPRTGKTVIINQNRHNLHSAATANLAPFVAGGRFREAVGRWSSVRYILLSAALLCLLFVFRRLLLWRYNVQQLRRELSEVV